MSAIRMWVALAWIVGCAATAAAQEGPQYAGADSCKTCHQAIYDVWANTKHAKTFNRLSAEDKKTECVRCHVTGTAEQIAAEADAPKFPGAQCESCHGPGSLHVADPKVMTGVAKKPAERACTKCHNDKSPHYHGFMYAAMAGFSHPVKK
jgi:excinuclease UvrABC ATPase subunit